MPKSLKFIVVASLFIICLLTLYRTIIGYIAFPVTANPNISAYMSYGLILDLKLVGVIMLAAIVLSNIPKCHFYKDDFGKLLAIVLFGLTGLILVGYYLLDVASIMSLRERLDYSIYQSILKNDEQGQIFRQKFSWTTFSIIVAIGTWLYTLSIIGIHSLFKKSKVKKGNDKQRYILTSIFIILSIIMIRGSVFSKSLTPQIAEKAINPTDMVGAINPIISLIYKYELPDNIK